MSKDKSKVLAYPAANDNPVLSPAEVAENEKRVRGEACAQEINAVLAKFGCQFSPVVVIANGKIETQINIVAG